MVVRKTLTDLTGRDSSRAAARDAMTLAQAAHQQELGAARQEAVAALTLREREARAMAARLDIVEQQLRNCLAYHGHKNGENLNKRSRIHKPEHNRK